MSLILTLMSLDMHSSAATPTCVLARARRLWGEFIMRLRIVKDLLSIASSDGSSAPKKGH